MKGRLAVSKTWLTLGEASLTVPKSPEARASRQENAVNTLAPGATPPRLKSSSSDGLSTWSDKLGQLLDSVAPILLKWRNSNSSSIRVEAVLRGRGRLTHVETESREG